MTIKSVYSEYCTRLSIRLLGSIYVSLGFSGLPSTTCCLTLSLDHYLRKWLSRRNGFVKYAKRLSASTLAGIPIHLGDCLESPPFSEATCFWKVLFNLSVVRTISEGERKLSKILTPRRRTAQYARASLSGFCALQGTDQSNSAAKFSLTHV